MLTTDKLLDIYNDYKLLYEKFGDYKYKQVMEEVIRRLKINIEIKQKKR